MSSGIIGEYFVICELLRMNFNVAVSPNPKNEEWDILVIKNTEDGGETNIKLQVKTVTWPQAGSSTKPAIQGKFTDNFDFLIIVVVGFYRTQKYAVYVIPKDDLEMAENGQFGAIPSCDSDNIYYSVSEKKKKSTIPFSTFKNKPKRVILNRRYRNRWDRL